MGVDDEPPGVARNCLIHRNCLIQWYDPEQVTRHPAQRATSAHGVRKLQAATTRRDHAMPQMFDWIFFAIVLLPTGFLVWDWMKNR